MTRRFMLLTAAALAATVISTSDVRSQAGLPPILLVVNSASPNPFGPYLAEILRAEGINSFAVAQLSTVTASNIAAYSAVVLAETPLTDNQALVFGNYVAGGGRLVAMRPDARLANVLGITPLGTSTIRGYIGINTNSLIGEGLTATTLPFHGAAQHLTPASGATTVAALYSDASTSTGLPAVVRFGRTAAWSFDLARTVAYSRQGDPANAGVDRDGLAPLRTNDVFYQAIDRDRVGIPHADVHMRLFTRVLSDLLADAMPLPRMWYFPNAKRTLLVLTSDSHANPQSWFDRVITSVEARGGRVSFYVFGGSDPSAASVQTWRSRGHEVGMHPAAFQNGWTIEQALQNAESYFINAGIAPQSATERLHQVEWQGWVGAAQTLTNHNIRLDTSFYTWGPAVTYPDGRQAHGFINASGLPMKFVDQTGAIVPVYQLVTSIVDEQLLVGDYSEHLTPDQALAVTRQLIDDSQAGGHSALMTQFHVDYFGFGEVQPWAEGTMDYAQSLGIPMWTAERYLNYVTARASTALSSLTWNNVARQLSFTVSVPAGAEPESLLLPGTWDLFALTSVTVDGVAASPTSQQIASRATSFLNVSPGAHAVVATYNTPIPPPEHAPVAVNDTASASEGATTTIAVLANDTDMDGDPLTVVSASSPGGAVGINPNQTISYTPNAGTCGSDVITYTISDGRGGTASATVGLTVTCVNGQVIHRTAADFAAACAIPTNTIVSLVADGEVRLSGAVGDEYVQPTLNAARWVAGTWAGGSYTPSIANGVLSISNASGAFVRSVSVVPVATLESTARFTSLPWEHIGYAALDFNGGYAIFSTFSSSTNLFARTSPDGTTEQQTNLGPIPSGFHTYRIDRQATSGTLDTISYYIDGVLKAQHTVATLPSLYVYQSHNGGASQALSIDRIWIYPPYVTSGTFQGCPMDIGHTLSRWSTASWSATVPGGTSLQVRTRTSPDGTTWSGWSDPLTTSGQDITSPSNRYLQYLVEFTTSSASLSPILESVTMRYVDASLPPQRSPIANSDAASTVEGQAVTINVLANDSDPDGDPLVIASVTQGTNGTVTISQNQTVTYTPQPSVCGPDTFSYTISDSRGGTATATVSINVACLTGSRVHTTTADFAPACAVPLGTAATATGGGEVRLAGAQSDQYSQPTLDSSKWVAGTWTGGAYSPTISSGVLSITDPAGAFVHSTASSSVSTVEALARFSGAPSEHVGWGSLDFANGYLIFSTFNTTTNLFVRSSDGGGEQRTDLGPIPAGFHRYRIERQATSPTSNVISYYVDDVLRAQHAVGNLPAMYVYQSYDGGVGPTLDIDNISVYPPYVPSGTYQGCALDAGTADVQWTTAEWTGTVPSGTTLQVRTRTSNDQAAWSDWSAPLTASGQSIASPVGRYLQYLLEISSGDPAVTPIVDSITMRYLLGGVDSTPPVISNVAASGITGSSATISWTTSEPATSQVQYGATPAYGNATTFDGTLSTSHAQTITGLNLGTLYNFRVISRDAANNETASANSTFTTSGPAPSASINDVSVQEGNAGTVNLTFTVTLSGSSGQTVTLGYDTADGTAAAPADFVASSGTVTFDPGSTSQTVTITVNGDLLNEADETLSVNLKNPVGATIADGAGTGTILNDDPLPSLSLNSPSAAEGDAGTTNATFTVTLSAASGRAVTVAYQTADGSATSGSDYTAASNTVTIPAGGASTTFTVPITGDTTLEPNEQFVVNLSSPVNATLGTSQGTATILNDDAPVVSIDDVTTPEGNSGSTNAVFTVTLSQPTTRTVTVAYATANQTAIAPGDYSSRSGSLTFAGTTSATIIVPVIGDTLSEAVETYAVNLTSPVNATLQDPQGIGTIVDGTDPLPALSIADVSMPEPGTTQPMTFTVTMLPASGQTVSVNYATSDGTATADVDYTPASGTLTFPAGTTTQTVSVDILPDAAPEPNETLNLTLSAPANATMSRSQAIGLINDTDGTIALTSPNTAVTWAVGSTQAITWTSNLDPAAAINLEISRNGGSSWSPLASGIANTGTFAWTVTSPATNSARVRASWAANTLVSDASNVNFTIANPTLTVTSPSNNVIWRVGTTATITWTSNFPPSENVRIELSLNGGTSYSVLIASTPNDGTEGLTVLAAWRTARARVRVSRITTPTTSDTSNGNFNIQ